MTDERQFAPLPALPDAARVVVIAAHHDDIEFGLAGSVARWTSEGATVTYVIITDGGAGSNEPGVIREELAETRRIEQIEAAKAVGVTDVRFLGYQDGVLQPTLELRKDLTRILRDVKPYRVVCQDPTTVLFRDSYINHPDHRAAGEAALYATFPSSETRPIFPELLDEGYEPHKISELLLNLTLKPTHFVDVTDFMDHKLASLKAHASQIGTGDDAERGALKWTKERMNETGQLVGVPYAEVFRMMKFDGQANEVPEDDVPEEVVK